MGSPPCMSTKEGSGHSFDAILQMKRMSLSPLTVQHELPKDMVNHAPNLLMVSFLCNHYIVHSLHCACDGFSAALAASVEVKGVSNILLPSEVYLHLPLQCSPPLKTSLDLHLTTLALF